MSTNETPSSRPLSGGFVGNQRGNECGSPDLLHGSTPTPFPKDVDEGGPSEGSVVKVRHDSSRHVGFLNSLTLDVSDTDYSREKGPTS